MPGVLVTLGQMGKELEDKDLEVLKNIPSSAVVIFIEDSADSRKKVFKSFVQNGTVSIGEFVAFYSYVGMMLGPISTLSGMSVTFAQGMVGASRIIKLLNTIPEIKECENPLHPLI